MVMNQVRNVSQYLHPIIIYKFDQYSKMIASEITEVQLTRQCLNYLEITSLCVLPPLVSHRVLIGLAFDSTGIEK